MIHVKMYESYEKVCSTIESCNKQLQIPTCLNLIHQFREVYGDVSGSHQLFNNLYEKVTEQACKISGM